MASSPSPGLYAPGPGVLLRRCSVMPSVSGWGNVTITQQITCSCTCSLRQSLWVLTWHTFGAERICTGTLPDRICGLIIQGRGRLVRIFLVAAAASKANAFGVPVGAAVILSRPRPRVICGRQGALFQPGATTGELPWVCSSRPRPALVIVATISYPASATHHSSSREPWATSRQAPFSMSRRILIYDCA